MKIARVTVVDVVRVPGYVAWPILAVFAYACLHFFANRAIYYPSKYPAGFWELQRSLGPAKDVWIETRDGVRLNAWWVPREGALGVTLYLHGNAGNVTDRVPHIREIVAAGSSILVLDYRGYGKSGGRPSEKGLYMDSEAAFAHLLGMGYRGDQIIVHGESLGTAVAVNLASRQSCAGVILEAPFTSASDVAGTVLPVLGPLLVRSYNSVSKIHAVLAPKLFLEGDRDEVIPPRLAHALYEAARGPKEFWVVESAGHNDIVERAGTRYRERLEKFYEEIGRR